jgi:membrane protein required for colicin V production
MNFIDIIICIPLIYAAYKGFKHGLIIEVFTLLALFVGLYVGIHFSDFVANFLKETLEWESVYLPIISFTLVFLAVGAMVYFAGKAIEKVVKVVHLTPLNKFFGLIFAVLKMLYIVSVLLVIVESYDEKGQFFPKTQKEGALLYNPVKAFSTTTIPGLESSTIFLKNAFKQEQDSTGLSVHQVLRAKEIADSLGLDATNTQDLQAIHNKYGEK